MNRVLKLVFVFLLIFFQTFSIGQVEKKDFDTKESLEKVDAIKDRAGSTHNASNIGVFFENRGKLYPRRITQGPSGEFPINSTKNYIYRVNPLIGIPGNVVQSRFTTNEEWEAVGGYHNSDTARIAFSDDPNSWNKNLGWPIKDANGNNIIISDQDSYCVYNDSNNVIKILGLQVAQTGYAFGTTFAKNMLFFKYELTNNGPNDLKGVYFSLHNDIDVGNISGGSPEYGDDKIDFIKEKKLLYFYDDGLSSEWPDGKTGFFGIMFLKTPEVNGEELGITDMHYMLYDDDEISDVDSVQYGYMSSSQNLFNSSFGSKYFHIGNNSNIHFDDPSTIPVSGIDLLANIASGPYDLNRGDTLVFYTAFVAGDTKEELLNASTVAQNAMDANFNLPKPPSRPALNSSSGNFKVDLFWDDIAESSFDEFSGYDFEGYRLYRSRNKGITWDKIAEFDVVNSIGKNSGLQYNYTDTSVINGFEYWYSITAYDKGSSTIECLESPIGNTLEAINTISGTPRSDAIGREPVSIIDVANLNTGNTNYELRASVIDEESLSGNEFKVNFNYIPRIENGDLSTNVLIIISDSLLTKPYKYSIEFTSPNSFDLKNATLNTIIRAGYNYPVGGRDVVISSDGLRIRLSDSSGTGSQYLPEQGDIITINFAISVLKNNAELVIKNRPYQINQVQTTNDGISLEIVEPEIIKNVSRIGGTDEVKMNFHVLNSDSIIEKMYVVSIEGNGISAGKGFVMLSVSETNIQNDTLYSGDVFNFEGIEGTITFPINVPPSAGNKFSFETIKPILPNIRDSYTFKIESSKVDAVKIKNELSKIRVVPNPYIASSLYEPEFGELRREPLRQIQFVNLPPECTIYIFTVDADLIKTLEHNSTNGTEVWDLRTEGGRELASGIYIYLVKTKTTEFKERFAIIK
ncbi:MAG: hypothetical protein KDC67_00305 [Ignavibacteriae bacterium]|nr:hypothetical protein [Ignavibacteriota bacterium]